MRMRSAVIIFLMVGFTAACGKKTPPLARPAPPPPTTASTGAPARPPSPPEPVAEPTVVPPEPVPSDSISSASLDDLNRNSPLKPVFFELDSAELAPVAQAALTENAAAAQAISHLDRDDRRTLRRARHRRVQSGVGRTTSGCRSRVSRVARHSRRPAEDRQLRQGISVRRGTRRCRVRKEPARALRHHREVRNHAIHTFTAGNAESTEPVWLCVLCDLGGCRLPRAAVMPAAAQSKEQRQMMADLRMLQEQNQTLQNVLGSIVEAIKAVNGRMDDQAKVTSKAIADQKLVVDNLTNTVRVIREKLDDNNVRLGSLTRKSKRCGRAFNSATRVRPHPTRPRPKPVTCPAPATPLRARRGASACGRARHVAPKIVGRGVGRLHARPVGSRYRRLRGLHQLLPEIRRSG